MSKNFIKGAIKRPGIEKRRAKQAGISTHEQLVRDSHSDNPTRKKEGDLGLTLTRMAHKHK